MDRRAVHGARHGLFESGRWFRVGRIIEPVVDGGGVDARQVAPGVSLRRFEQAFDVARMKELFRNLHKPDRLLPCHREMHIAFDDDGDGVGRHEKQKNQDRVPHASHRLPDLHRTERTCIHDRLRIIAMN